MPTHPLPIKLPEDVIIVRFDAPSGDPRHMPAFMMLGDEDKAAMTALLTEMKTPNGRSYIVDLTGRTFCGTMRLGQLLRMQQALRSTGRVLRIAADQRELLDVFRLTRLNTIMPVFSSLTEAVADAVRPI